VAPEVRAELAVATLAGTAARTKLPATTRAEMLKPETATAKVEPLARRAAAKMARAKPGKAEPAVAVAKAARRLKPRRSTAAKSLAWATKWCGNA
jgi:hypothetical protein